MTGLPDNNGNDFIRGLETRACVNGMTKSDVERLKNALVKKILDDKTVIDVTEDGSIIADSNGMFISVNGKLLGLSVDGEDIIPVTEPYLPEDENENPLVPENDIIMTSANIAVDPRIVRTTGNQTISGNKIFSAPTVINRLERGYNLIVLRGGEWAKLYEFNPATYGANIYFSIVNFWALSSFINSEIRIGVSNIPDYELSGLMIGVESYIEGKVARRNDNVIEVWIHNTLTTGIDISTEITHVRSTTPIPKAVIGSMPVVGATYVDVVNMTVQS